MLENLEGRRVLLASGSPRRRELLAAMGISFTVVCKPGIDESYPSELKAKHVAEYIAGKKADAYTGDLLPGDLLITADTCVIVDGEVLGKPADEAQAMWMLERLNGRTHRVITGVALTTLADRVTFSVKTKVTMRSLPADLIAQYVERCHPLDKAGAYGIQEWIGVVGIDYIEGSYQNVMGLPTQRLYAELCKV